MSDILPFALSSSSQSSGVSEPQLPEYADMPESVIDPVCVSIVTFPLAGTTTENHTSLPVKEAHVGLVPEDEVVAPTVV